MKRLWVCAVLLMFAVGICISARLSLQRTAEGERQLLLAAQQSLQTEDNDTIDRAISDCECYWEENSLPFYLFVDHNFFNNFEYTLFHLRDYATAEKGLACERIGFCLAVLQDLTDSQLPVLENIF